jgi:hypothetical protein
MAFRLLLAFALFVGGARSTAAQDIERDHRRSCESGEVRACTILGLIYETGAAGERDLARALALYQRACDFGVSAGCTRLALAQGARPDSSRENGFVRVGHIADSDTGGPIGDAVVEVPALGLRVLADEAGRVDLGRLPRGSHRVTAGRLGYSRVEGTLPSPWDTDFLMLLDRSEPNAEATLGSVFGRVLEEGTGRALAYVDITLAGPPPVQTITTADGRFSLAGLEPGPVEVTFSLLGYAPRTTTIIVQAGETLDVRATLSTQAIELPAIEVSIGSGYLERTGFYRRSRLSMGVQFTRQDLVRMNAVVASDILLRAPGVSVVQGRDGARVVSGRAGGATGQGGCRLRAYLDGMAVHDFDFDSVRPDDLEAIEIYHGPSVPIEYSRLVDPDGVYPCGAILIWTRRDE